VVLTPLQNPHESALFYSDCHIAVAMDSTGKITEPPRRPSQEASAALISAVLGNDDILLCLDFPTYLVRAATVSKR